jgi:uncharacterized membrane protein
MIPYLLAENPNMSSKEAFRRTKELMSNNKMDTFVLDLSFIGWILLSACTFGILMIFFVRPYIYLVETELYVALCRGKNSNNRGENYNSSEFNSEYQEI